MGQGEANRERANRPLRRSASVVLVLLLWALAGPASHAAVDDCSKGEGVALQVLGSGGPIADDARASSAYLLWVDGASRALVDVGGGAFLRFGQAGADFRDLDFIGVSHFHADHSADLPALLKSGYFARRERPLAIAGPGPQGNFPGLGEFLEGLLGSERGIYRYLGGYLDGSGGLPRLDPTEIPLQPGAESVGIALEPGRIAAEARPVPHGIVPAVAFRLNVGERSIVFASDQNGSDPGFAEFARRTDLLVMHMAIPEDADGVARKLHATPSRIGQIAAAAEAGQLLLSHFMARSLTRLEDSVAAVRRQYAGSVTVAEDLACIALP
jgi:ribonuclease BN (tRNA processing enzyme)